MAKELTGGCACGSVHYKITGRVRLAVNCHCNSCRKRNGAAYSTYCAVMEPHFAIVSGQENLTQYENGLGSKKFFCTKCGSPIYNQNVNLLGMLMVIYGSLDDCPEITPAYNVYCESQLPWVENIATMQSFAKTIER